MYVKQRGGHAAIWRPPQSKPKHLQQSDHNEEPEKDADMEALFGRVIRKHTEKLRVDERIPASLAKDFYQSIASYQRTAPAILAKSAAQAAETFQSNPQQALSSLTGDILTQMERQNNMVIVHGTLFQRYLTIVAERKEESYLFVSERGSETCDVCARLHGHLFSKKDLGDGGIIPPLHPNCRCSLVALDTAGVRYYNGPNGAQMLQRLQVYLDGMGGAGLFALEPYYDSLRMHPDDLKQLDAFTETLISGVDPEAKQAFRVIFRLVEDVERCASEAMAQFLEDAKATALKILESTVILIEAFCENINLRLEEAWALWEEGKWLRTFLVASDAVLGTFVSSFFTELSSRISDFEADPNGLTLANLLTLGLVDMVQGTFFPEEMFSPEHMTDVYGLAITVVVFVLTRNNLGRTFRTADDVIAGVADDLLKPADDMLRAAKHGLTQSQIDEIVRLGKGDRPDPTTYLSKSYIENHLAMCQDGVTKIRASAPEGAFGAPEGMFVFPASVVDDLLKQAGGDIARLEELLGLPHGALGDNPVRIDIQNPSGLRMPSGNEAGANSQWIPGGYTSGGIPEVVIDPVNPGSYIVREIQ